MKSSGLNWSVLGAGAIGSLWAVKLKQAGSTVTLIVKPEQVPPKKKSLLVRFQDQIKITPNSSSPESSEKHHDSFCKSSSSLPSSQSQSSVSETEKNAELEFSCTSDLPPQTDVLLICVKAHQVEKAMQQINKHIPKGCLVIFMHNGMGCYEACVRNGIIRLDTYSVMLATTSHGCVQTSHTNSQGNHILQATHTGLGTTNIGYAPQIIPHTGHKHSTISPNNDNGCNSNNNNDNGCNSNNNNNNNKPSSLQSYPFPSPHPSHQQTHPHPYHHDLILETLSRALPPVLWRDDMQHALWMKLAINCAINPLTALYGCTNGELLRDERRWGQVMSVIDEIEELFDKMQLGFSKEQLRDSVRKVVEDTAENTSSMLRDVQEGRETEIEFITGYLIRCAAQWDVGMSFNKSLCDAVKAIPIKEKRGAP